MLNGCTFLNQKQECLIKKDKVTQPMEAKVKKKKGGKVMFSRGGGVATQGTKFSRNG